MSAKMHLVSVAKPSHPELVRLVIPADARYLAAVRLVAAAVASDLDFTVDDIDELRMGVDEAVAVLIGHSDRDDRIDLSFTLSRSGPSMLLVEGTLVDDDGAAVERPAPDGDPVDPLARRIVAAVTDACALGASSFRLEKATSIAGG